jgi:type II secretory pathway component PulM
MKHQRPSTSKRAEAIIDEVHTCAVGIFEKQAQPGVLSGQLLYELLRQVYDHGYNEGSLDANCEAIQSKVDASGKSLLEWLQEEARL